MPSQLSSDNIADDEDDLQACMDDPSLASLMRVDSNELSVNVNLDAVRMSMMRSLSASHSAGVVLTDKVLLDSLPLASKLLIESFEETEKALSTGDSPLNVGSRLKLWQSSLEPWHEFLNHVRNLESCVAACSMSGLLDGLPEIIRTVFSHCKRSESLYGRRFNDLLPQLTALFRQTNALLESFFVVLESSIKFDDDTSSEGNVLRTIVNKIGDIAALTNGMDLRTLLSTWKAFAKLAAVHEPLIKKLALAGCITRRYVDVAKDIRTLLHDSFRDKRETNYERAIKCAGLLLKILGRLCTLYRGYCENKVSDALVQLLASLYRYSPPFPTERIAAVHLKITECSETHVVPATAELLNTLVEEKDFSRAFFEYDKSEVEEPICYHLLTLRIIEELVKRRNVDLPFWLRDKDNIVEVALDNANFCCAKFLLDDLQISIRSEMTSGALQQMGVYEATLRLLCCLVARASSEEFATVESALLRHLLSGEFWSSLISCDLWTHLASISSPKYCHELLSFLVEVLQNFTTRVKSTEFEFLSNLVGRLYKLLPEETKESVFRELDDYSNHRLVDPFRASLPPRARLHMSRHPSIDTTSNLTVILQDLRRSPSLKNWTQLISLLKSVEAAALPIDQRVCVVALRDIWIFNATNIPRAQGIARDMLLELTALLFNCTRFDGSKNQNNYRLVVSAYKSMMEISEHVPTEHRIRMNIYLRDNLESYDNECIEQCLPLMTELFGCLVDDENPWVRQESFETYAEHILSIPSGVIVDNLSRGILKLPRLYDEMCSYVSNTKIHALEHHESLETYLRELADASRRRVTSHKCYEPEFRQRDEKMPRTETASLDERVADICDDLRCIVAKKNELSNASIDRLRAVLLQLLEP